MKNSLEIELSSIQQETNPEFQRLLNIITLERDESIASAEYFRNYSLDISLKLFEMELKNLYSEITTEKESLKDKMLIGLEEKKRLLEFELNSFEFNNGNFSTLEILDPQNLNYRLPNRKVRGSSLSNQKPVDEKILGRKRKNQNVANVNLLLKEHEIYDDISYFRRMGISGRRVQSRK